MELAVSRGLCKARAHGICEGCGGYVGGALDAHHRQARGMGGVSRAAAVVANDVRNLLALCRACHDRTEEASEWAFCISVGWRIPHYVEVDPRWVPAMIHTVNGYGWWRLHEDGGYVWVGFETTTRIEYDSECPSGWTTVSSG